MLRLAVTDRCNLRCAYCMPPNGARPVPRAELLPLDELAWLVRWLHRLRPFARVKLTGGEPLVRPGIERLVERLAALPGGPELSMTTNGSRLARQAESLAAAGLARVNVSLDTVDPDRYREITRGGALDRVLAGLDAAARLGLAPIKLNAVLRRSSWRDDVPALLDLAASGGYSLRFIELMRTGTERSWCAAEAVAAAEVLAWLGAHPSCGSIQGHDLTEHGAEPARRGRVRWRGVDLEVGWILPVSRPFCASCDRLRLDARGRVRRCLMDSHRLDLAGILAAEGEQPARGALDGYLAGKRPPATMDTGLPMAQLGG
jgi:cyclic pyranopterin phosphate synthase